MCVRRVKSKLYRPSAFAAVYTYPPVYFSEHKRETYYSLNFKLRNENETDCVYTHDSGSLGSGESTTERELSLAGASLRKTPTLVSRSTAPGPCPDSGE